MILDFRKQIDGLVSFIAADFELNPASGQLFVFRNSKADKIKILVWDRNGFWLLYKRLEKGRFKYPAILDEQEELSSEQLSWLISGLDLKKCRPLPQINATKFY